MLFVLQNYRNATGAIWQFSAAFVATVTCTLTLNFLFSKTILLNMKRLEDRKLYLAKYQGRV